MTAVCHPGFLKLKFLTAENSVDVFSIIVQILLSLVTPFHSLPLTTENMSVPFAILKCVSTLLICCSSYISVILVKMFFLYTVFIVYAFVFM